MTEKINPAECPKESCAGCDNLIECRTVALGDEEQASSITVLSPEEKRQYDKKNTAGAEAKVRQEQTALAKDASSGRFSKEN